RRVRGDRRRRPGRRHRGEAGGLRLLLREARDGREAPSRHRHSRWPRRRPGALRRCRAPSGPLPARGTRAAAVSGRDGYESTVAESAIADLRDRLARTRWPEQPAGHGWDLGTDLAYARELCEHWASGYDFARLERLNELGSFRWEGLHFLQAEGGDGGLPLVLLHGWPSGPLEYERAARLLASAGRTAVVPSLPGFAWSEDPGEPLDVAAVAARLLALLLDGLQLERFVVAGGDWGAPIGARMAFDAPQRVAGLYVSTPGVLPRPGDLSDPPLSEDERAFAERGLRWFRREGHHMAIQS